MARNWRDLLTLLSHSLSVLHITHSPLQARIKRGNEGEKECDGGETRSGIPTWVSRSDQMCRGNRTGRSLYVPLCLSEWLSGCQKWDMCGMWLLHSSLLHPPSPAARFEACLGWAPLIRHNYARLSPLQAQCDALFPATAQCTTLARATAHTAVHIAIPLP
jgi:hypothetical protein